MSDPNNGEANLANKRVRKPRIDHNIISVLAAIVAVLASLNVAMKEGGRLIETAAIEFNRSMDSFRSMWGPTHSEMTPGFNPAASEQIREQQENEPVLTGLGSKPDGNCNIFTAVDYSIVPPKTTSSWRCGD